MRKIRAIFIALVLISLLAISCTNGQPPARTPVDIEFVGKLTWIQNTTSDDYLVMKFLDREEAIVVDPDSLVGKISGNAFIDTWIYKFTDTGKDYGSRKVFSLISAKMFVEGYQR